MTPSPSDLDVMKRYGLKERLRFEDITTYEDDITPYRIWTIMNNEWDLYEKFCDKVKKLDALDDEIILQKLALSIKKHGWLAGHIAVVHDNGWHLIDGRHRFACAYALGVDCFIKPRLFKKEFTQLKEHSIKVFNLLPEKVVIALKNRYKILSLLKEIKLKVGSQYTFSSNYCIPELGIYGSDPYIFMKKHRDILINKRVLDVRCGVGMLSIHISRIAKEVIAYDSDTRYQQISSLLKSYFKCDNMHVVNTLDSFNEFDVVIRRNHENFEFVSLKGESGHNVI